MTYNELMQHIYEKKPMWYCKLPNIEGTKVTPIDYRESDGTFEAKVEDRFMDTHHTRFNTNHPQFFSIIEP